MILGGPGGQCGHIPEEGVIELERFSLSILKPRLRRKFFFGKGSCVVGPESGSEKVESGDVVEDEKAIECLPTGRPRARKASYS